jgi:CheY-like chemotaxis protein
MSATSLEIERTKVLVVDDSDDQRDLLSRYLERAGCDVVSVGSAEDAIIAYELSNPDLAFIDLVLPGMTGWALAERLRADMPLCAIAITSVLDAADYPAAQAILPKPFTRAEVRRVLRDTQPRDIQLNGSDSE